MSAVYLGLGSNLGDRRFYLESALRQIERLPEVTSMFVSSVYETPALLPADAPSEWNRSFWNLVAEVRFSGSPHEALKALQQIELRLGRTREQQWAPRSIDIDILYWYGIEVRDENLTIPHPRILERAFVLDPLAELAPQLVLPSTHLSVSDLARKHPQHSPRLMGIMNLTPDSFSDGGKYLSHDQTQDNIERSLKEWNALPVSIIDIGGESTRPGAMPIDSEQEWKRIGPGLNCIFKQNHNLFIRPKVSVDTRKFDIAAKAIELGVDIINVVGGLSDPPMIDLLKSSACKVILMHSLCAPPDPRVTLPKEESVSELVRQWLEKKLEFLYKSGIQQSRIILDPGIGFGKTATQSIQLLACLKWIQSLDCPVLIGHSRKSFLTCLRPGPSEARDPETLGVSMALAKMGVDILRVHDPILHHRAMMGWRSIQ